MGEVLSQAEIDNLLSALSSGELDMDEMQGQDDRQVKNYDFKRPAKFSKEHLRTLEIIYEHYGRLLSTNLPVYLRKSCQVSVVSSETVTFSEFSNALANPVVLGIVTFDPLPGNIIVELTANLAFAIIDRMLGGQGTPLEKSRDFSEIEMIIVEKIIVICIQLMRDPWKNVVEITPMLDRIETNPQFAQIISPSDMIAIVTLSIKVGDVEGFMNICLPYFTLENVMDKLNTKYWYSTIVDNKDEDFEEYIEAMLQHVDVPVKAVLGNSAISVNDFIHLQVGDIIRLDSKVDSDLNIYVGNIKKFTALPGAENDFYAVQVTSVIREEE
ncbi:MAG: flagellar motor switch protein FliM [Lachnospiraceae bacterium]|nr:flagellar motor switch protein FliM [Lachnospiraceae bacterium]